MHLTYVYFNKIKCDILQINCRAPQCSSIPNCSIFYTNDL